MTDRLSINLLSGFRAVRLSDLSTSMYLALTCAYITTILFLIRLAVSREATQMCTFEEAHSVCPCWNNSREDELDWTLQAGPTPSHLTGPGNGSYLYMEASNVASGSRARLESRPFPALTDGKLSFWYHMYEGGSYGCMGTLAVYFVSNADKNESWLAPATGVLSGSQGAEWKRMEIDLFSNQEFIVRIEAVRGRCYRSDIAIDNISYPLDCGRADMAIDGTWSLWSSWSSCSVTCGVGRRMSTRRCDNPPPLNGGKHCTVNGSRDTKHKDCNMSSCVLLACDFDQTCKYLSSHDSFFNELDSRVDDQNWYRRQGPTPTPGTGPTSDHTNGSGFYAYFEASHSASKYKHPGQNAHLVSRKLEQTTGSIHSCMTFYYHMHSLDTNPMGMGKLRVLIKTYEDNEGQMWKSEETVWTRSGNQGSEWLLGAVQIPLRVTFRVILEAVQGDSTLGRSDIAVDDIIIGVDCVGLPVKLCVHPGAPKNGATINSRNWLVYLAGSQIRFRCLPGYFMSRGGSVVRTCVNGQWTGTQITCYKPNCQNHPEGARLLDVCERSCVCINNQLRNCRRIRKEITTMPLTERERYVKTLKEFSRTRAYQNLIGLHSLVYDEGIHEKTYFLPWHRYYLLSMENHLRQFDCRVTVPYWDWSSVASRPFESRLWRSSDYYFGSSRGDKEDNYCIRDGPFEKGQWFWVDRDRVSLPREFSCLKRRANVAATFYNKLQIADALERARWHSNGLELEFKFTAFEAELRVNMHMGVHCAIMGDMCTHEAANAPEFFLHHGMVDLIWAKYQSLDAAHYNVYYNKTSSFMMSSHGRSLSGPSRLRATDLFNISDLPKLGSTEPGLVSVEYQAMDGVLDEALSTLGLSELEAVCSGIPTDLPASMWQAFRVSQDDRAAAIALMRRMQLATNGSCESEEAMRQQIDSPLGFDLKMVVSLLHQHGRIDKRSVKHLRRYYLADRK